MKELEAGGAKAMAVTSDITDYAATKEAVAAHRERWARSTS